MSIEKRRKARAGSSLTLRRIARAVSRALGRRGIARPHHRVEPLEERRLMATTPIINEFMASNNTGFQDSSYPAERPDWIELYNPTASSIDLGSGWKLKDDANIWSFPAGATLPAGGYLTVFATSKNLTSPSGRYHTNFNLSKDGEYLALVNPSNDVVHEYIPSFPPQETDISYGVAQQAITQTFVGPAASIKGFVPANGSLGNTWWNATGFDDSGWLNGTGGAGFETETAPPPAPAGFNMKMIDTSAGDISNIAIAKQLLDNNGTLAGFTVASNITQTRTRIDTLELGRFANNDPLPNGATSATSNTNALRQQYALRITAHVTIPQGTYTIGVNSDDGFQLSIPGVTFFNRLNENSMFASSAAHQLTFSAPRGSSDTLGSFTIPSGGLQTTIQLDMFEQGGGDSVELFVASGQKGGFDGTFSLLQDTTLGWAVKQSAANPTFTGLFGLNMLTPMRNVNASAYLRAPFVVEQATDFANVRLKMRYDDGFVAYINGQEVARRNAPGAVNTPPNFNATATGSHADTLAVIDEEFIIPVTPGLLVNGQNMLSIHALNQSAGDVDFLMVPTLEGLTPTVDVERYFGTPTPGAVNSTAYQGRVDDTKFSHDRGFYSAPFQLTISTTTDGSQIRYTLDGTPPTSTTGLVYNGPITIDKTTTLRAAAFKSGFLQTNVDTHTYIFVDDVITQSANGQAPAGWPSSWGSNVVDYGMDPDVVNNPTYNATIKNDLKTIPSLSIVTELRHLFDPSTGIIANPSGDGIAWERPTSLELINPDGSNGFQVNAGLRIRGGYSRSTNNPKHAFRVLFRPEYGDSQLEYDLFKSMDGTEVLDGFDIRTMQNYSWSFDPGGGGNMIAVRDMFSRDTQYAMGHNAERGDYYHLYVNGQYWGLFNTAERPEASYGASYYGGNPDDYDVVKVGPDLGYTTYATDGNTNAWFDFYNQAKAIGALSNGNAQIPILYKKLLGLNPDGTRNPAYPVYLDPDNLIDYMLTIIYGGNRDAPISAFLNNDRPNNFYALRNRNDPDMPWQYFSHDAEHTLLVADVGLNRLGPFNSAEFQNNNYSNPQSIWQWLWKSDDFKMEIADHLHKHFFNGGALTPGAVSARLIGRRDEINRAIVGESARWGDSKTGSNPYTHATWLNNFNNVLNNYVPQRSSIVLNQFLSAGLYPTLDAPELNQFGGTINPGFNITLSRPDNLGTVYYTLDGTDPRLPGGALNPNAIAYSGAVTLNDTAKVFARILNGATWSPSTEALFANATVPKLRVSEIMYHPVDPAADSPYGASDFEYIEVINIGAVPLDVSNYSFDRGLDFTFTGSTILQPGERAVIVANLAAFQSRYPGITPLGVFAGDLDNSGERIRLVGRFGETIQNFTYNDGWYDHTDGEGFSLVATDTNQGLTLFDAKEGWRASANLNGDPDSLVPSLNPKSIAINEILANTTANQTWIELKNTTGQDIDISGWFLSDSNLDLKKYKFGPGTIIGDGEFLLLNEQTSYGLVGGAGVTTVFTLAANDGTVYLSSADGTEALLGYREEQDYGTGVGGQSFGRYIKSNGAQDFPILTTATPGAENAAPVVGPVIISEINYSPTGTGQEFIELRNTSGSVVELFDPANPTNTWRFSSGVNFSFPQGATIAAFGYALVVGIDPAAFRTQFNVPAAIPIFGPYTGFLDNAGENLVLQKPGTPDGLGNVPYIVVDRVNYDSSAPWPTTPNGTGPSLIRENPLDYGNDPENWQASSQNGGSPGFSNLPSVPPQITMAPMSSSTEGAVWQLSGSFTDVDAGQTFTAEVNWGDSVTTFPLTLNPDGTFSLSHLFADSGNFNVRVRVTDSGNAFQDAFCLVTVANIAPTAVFVAVGGATMNEGAPKSVRFVNRFDPSSPDTIAGFQHSVDWDNDGTYDLVNSPLDLIAIPQQFVADGPQTRVIKGKIADKNGGFNEYTITLTINNIIPIIDPIDDWNMPAPGNYSNSGTFIDAVADLPNLVGSVDWNYHPGDTDSVPLILDTESLFFNLNHNFASPGVYTVRVRIADDEGAVGIRDFQVSVAGDTTPPTVIATSFAFESAPRRLKAQFSEDVYTSLLADPTAISIFNLTSQSAVPASAYSLSYDTVTNWATWTFNAEVADGNYTLTLSGAKIKDSSGNLLDGDGNASAGGDHVFAFWHLLGDVDRDRQVGFTDLLATAAGFGTGTTLAQGDVDGDGAVGFTDLLQVSAKFGTTLPAPAAPVAAAAPVTSSATPTAVAAPATTPVASKPTTIAPKKPSVASKPGDPVNAPTSPFSAKKIAGVKKRSDLLA